MNFKIAIDGPAGAGKSTIAKIVAKKLGIEYLDTGAMYRAITLKALRLGINLENENEYDFIFSTTIDFINGNVYMDGEDVSEAIRSLEVTNNASLVSSFSNVRTEMVEQQRKLGGMKAVIVDGRDIGTVVFPDANLKVFLIASPEVRAMRRMKERVEKGTNTQTLEETIEEINARDFKDSTRAISPLKKADDAIEVDTSNMNIDAVVEEIIRLVTERGFKMEDVKVVNEEVKEETEVSVEESAEVVAQEEKVEEIANEEQAPQLKELQLVEGVVVEVLAPEQEKKNNEGKVVKKAKEARVLVKLDNGQEGYLFRKEVPGIESDDDLFDEFIEGDRLRLVVKRVYPDGGKVLLSAALLEKRDNLAKFEEVIKEHGTFTAKVVKSIQVGLVLEYDGYSCLLPTTQVDVKEDEVDSLVGTEIEVAPIRVDYNRIRLIVSQKVANAIKNRKAKEEFLKTVELGNVYEGTVKNIETYGAFVDLGNGVEGLLHISEVEHNRIVKIEKVLNVGDRVQVKVIKLTEGHIGLSRKALLPNYWKDFIDASSVDQEVKGTVVEVNNAGVVVALTEQIQGFLPKSECSWDREAVLAELFKAGEEVNAKIIELDLNKKRVILSVKKLTENPWETLGLKTNDVVSCKVTKVTEEGVKFNTSGITGFLPKGNFGEKTEFAEGEEFEAKVRVFDSEKNRLLVSMREARPKVEKERKPRENNEVNKLLKNQEKISSTFADFINLDDYK